MVTASNLLEKKFHKILESLINQQGCSHFKLETLETSSANTEICWQLVGRLGTRF